MASNIPTPAEVKAALADLSHAQVVRLSALSGVPVPSLWRVRAGTTTNPGIKLVSAIWPFVSEAQTIT